MKSMNFGLIIIFASLCQVSIAGSLNDWHGCRNCEALVTLDSAKAEEFAINVSIISSMPLDALVIDQGQQGGKALVLVGT